jgi:phosphoglycerate dehydrogenase-like enzyme
MHAKRMPVYQAQQREGVWQRAPSSTLRGATVAIVGLGAIGSETARLCQAFGARVLASRRSARPGDTAEHCDTLFGPADLHPLVAQADYVVLAVPLTPETRGFFGAAEFAAMQPSAALVNIARGAVVDWPAMLEALRAGRIAAVYTDVTVPEPLPPDDASWRTPNLFITPHNSGLFPDYLDRATEMFVENLRRYRAGQPLLRLVDRRLGY